MRLPAGATVRINPGSPYFPAYHGQVSSDGNKLVIGCVVYVYVEPPGYYYGPVSEGCRTWYEFDPPNIFVLVNGPPKDPVYAGTWEVV